MHYTSFLPHPSLAPYVDSYWTLEGPAECDAPWDRILPDGCVELVFNLADPFQRSHGRQNIETQPAALLVGQMRSFAMVRPTGAVRLFGVRFHPHGAYSFLQIPVKALTDSIVSMEDVLCSDGTELHDMLACARSTQAMIRVFERAFFKRLKKDCRHSSSVAFIVHKILRERGPIQISECADAAGMSERHLERKFQTEVGLSPKRFTRILRMQKLLRILEREEGLSWSHVALEYGYFDQAHFIREFKEFCGVTPRLFLHEQHPLMHLFTRGQPSSRTSNPPPVGLRLTRG